MKYSKIMVPLDESPRSESVIPLAAQIASALSIPVELFHVVEADVVTLKRLAGMKREQSVEEDLATVGNAYLQRVARKVPAPFNVSCKVAIGHAAESIIDEAAKDSEVLIAMATRGLSGVKKWVLGSVADKILQASVNPLLLVKSASEEKFERQFAIKRVIVPLDGSPLAEVALSHAIPIAKNLNANMELLRAYQMPIGVSAPTPYLPSAEAVTAEALREEVEVYLRDKVSQARAEGVENTSYVLAMGDSAQQIIDMADQNPDALVVMSSHGRSGVGRWLLGSVAARVASHASQPVLIVRAPSHD